MMKFSFLNKKIWSRKAVGFLLLISSSAMAYNGTKPGITADERPLELKDVGISEKLGHDIDQSVVVTDETGAKRTIGSFLGKRPLLLSLVYYSCPGLCNFHLNGLTDALKQLPPDWSVGGKFEVLALSFDAKEDSKLAVEKKASYLKVYERPNTEAGWHFLTTDQSNIDKITQNVGFKFKWNEEAKEWAHASAAIVISPEGKITRYLPGIVFQPQDVKLALIEGSQGTVGTFVEQMVLYCFKYNPHTSKYALYAINIMKLGGALMVLILGVWLLPVWYRNRNSVKLAARR